MASVHPPSRAVLEGTVAIKFVVVFVVSTKLHAVVRCEELVTRVISKVKAIKSVSCITTKVVAIGQTVHVNLGPHSEHGIVSIPDKKSGHKNQGMDLVW